MRMTTEKREAVMRRLLELENPDTGRVTPEAVVADAKRKDSPLHDLFEWDLKKAAHQHWIDRAREILTMRVTITTENTSVSVCGYIRDPAAGPREQGYVSIHRLRSDTDGSREALVAEFQRIRDLLNRARELAAAFELSDEVSDLVVRVAGLRDRVMQPPQQQQ